MSLMSQAKAIAQQIVPKSLEVPLRYHYRQATGNSEDEVGFIEHLVQPGDRVVDVGANRGLYAYRAWKLGARVEAFEPNPICLAVLEEWARGKATVAVHAVALSDKAGDAVLNIPLDGAGVEHDASASINEIATGAVREQPVSLRTLDSFAFGDIALVKIDVEGHETSVLDGATGTISALKPALLIEIEQRHTAGRMDDVFAKVLAFGYRGYFLRGGKLAPLTAFDAAKDQSLGDFGGRKSAYINNFLFLDAERKASNGYARFFSAYPV